MQRKDLSDINDEELMKLFCAGKNEGFDELYSRYYAKLLYYILQSTYFSKEEAKDLLQEVFIKIIDKKHSFNPDKKLSVWLYSITNNLSINAMKHRIVVNKYSSEYAMQNKNLHIDNTKSTKTIRAALNTLKPTHKQVFLLRFNFGFTIRETAEILELSEGTVKSRLFYCIKNLSHKEELKELHYKY